MQTSKEWEQAKSAVPMGCYTVEDCMEDLALHEKRIAALEVATRPPADANQAAADMLERMKKGAWVKIGGKDCQIMEVESVSAVYAERDALAAKVVERDNTIRAQEDHRIDLQKRLAVTETECRNLRNALQASERDAERWRKFESLTIRRIVDSAIAAESAKMTPQQARAMALDTMMRADLARSDAGEKEARDDTD